MLLTKPPLYKNAKTVREIAGEDFDTLKKHAKIYYGTSDPDLREKRLAKEFPAEKREKLGKIYQELRDNGIYITGITQQGELEISYAVIDDPAYQIDLAKKEAPSGNPERALSWIRKIQEKIHELADRCDINPASSVRQEKNDESEKFANFEELEEAPF